MIKWISILGGIAGIGTLAYALLTIGIALRRPAGRVEPGARFALYMPLLGLATLAFITFMVLTWRPVPLYLPETASTFLTVIGIPLYFAGLLLYLWGNRSLGKMFAPSSGFGVRLHSDHRLITSGPYAYIRHPMYLAVVIAGIGGFLLYRTWFMLFFAIGMNGLVVRAWREEKVLSQEFGAEWKEYVKRVPAWIPRLRKGKVL